MNDFITRDGLKLAYYVDDFTDPWRKPDTLLLLHAAMGNAQRWFQWVPRLARDWRVVRLDLRGHGRSQIPAADMEFSLSQLVGDALAVLDRVGAERAHIVGNSAGGYVSQQLAIHHPERVKTLALFGSTPGLKQSHAPTWIPKIQQVGLKKFLADTIDERFDGNADPALVRWFIEQAGSNDPAFIARFVTHMTTHDFMDEVSRIQAPTLIVAAGKERIGHADAYEEMHRRIKDSEVKYIDTGAHNICDGYALDCVEMLRDFLKRRG
ncbi:alpha/beta hydrolase [Ramlibacter henchirensis]|uniref:Alpha/beta hydrolase n=1 Tax=Ramlibacter henchirensis TaxID=204072 RepID=A0A4Z0BVR6_9BURK|nr:alpha/beta hydrolase [Ramlibacter henchirensis]TFZ02802.1 alpha/beta hydrolase [Ramlibacter henchirensis]